MENDDVNRITSLEDETERLLEKIQYLFGRIENYDDSMKQELVIVKITVTKIYLRILMVNVTG